MADWMEPYKMLSDRPLLPWQRKIGKFGLLFPKKNRFFFFVFRWNRAIFGPSVLREPLYKTLFFDFWFRPPNPQNLLPKIWPKIAHNSACMADRPKTFAPNRGFSGMADWIEPYKMLSGRPVFPWQRKIGKFGPLFHKNRFLFFLFFDGIEPFLRRQFSVNPSTKRCSSIFDLGPITPKIYSPKFDQKSPITRLVWQIDQRCLRVIGRFRGWPIEWTIQNVVGPTLVAMATKICQIWATFSQKSILLLCLSMESSHFWAVSSPCGALQNIVFNSIFDLGPLPPKNYSQQFALAQNHL